MSSGDTNTSHSAYGSSVQCSPGENVKAANNVRQTEVKSITVNVLWGIESGQRHTEACDQSCLMASYLFQDEKISDFVKYFRQKPWISGY